VEAEDVEERGFTEARGVHDRGEIALGDCEIDVPQRVVGTAFEGIDTVDVTEPDHGCGHGKIT
jgi:hypothetical protein